MMMQNLQNKAIDRYTRSNDNSFGVTSGSTSQSCARVACLMG